MSTHRVGRLADIPVGEGRAYAVGGQQVAVFHLRSGEVRALSAICPHRGGPIADGLLDGEQVVCPLHGNAYALTDGCSRTGEAPLKVFDVAIDGEDVVVTVPDLAVAGRE